MVWVRAAGVDHQNGRLSFESGSGAMPVNFQVPNSSAGPMLPIGGTVSRLFSIYAHGALGRTRLQAATGASGNASRLKCHRGAALLCP